MSSHNYRVRRATLDDLKPLTVLWAGMNFAVEELAPRITEFQVAESAAGGLLGAVGLHVVERQGCVHSEAFTDFALADYLRPLLWDRIQALALNQSLLRLWTREQAPFWSHCGLVPAEAEGLEKLPAVWRGPVAGWLTLKLRDDVDVIIKADQEFALFMQAEKQRTAKSLQQARMLKTLAVILAFGVLALAMAAMLYLVFKNRQMPRS